MNQRNRGNDIHHDITSWEENAQNVTFILTEDCQLRCKYCYICGKNSFNVMSWETAKKAVDFILTQPDYAEKPGVVLDFIGGEPLLEIELMGKICDYFKIRSYELDHPWKFNYRFSMATNGILYDNPVVQNFISRNKSHLSIGISVDGTPEKHNMNRVFADGSGSYEAIVRNLPLWICQFSGRTKATIAHSDLPYIKESVLHLWSLGITEISMNCVFENLWKPGDDEIFENQLVELADEIIEKKLYRGHKCSLFDRSIGFPMDPEKENQNWCGAGKMVAIGTDGKLFPCLRFAQYSLENKPEITIGTLDSGRDMNRLRSFLTLDRLTQSPQECIDCEVSSGCAWCQGCNYDFAETKTIFQRNVAICKMHKARVRANNYFWNKYDRIVQPSEDDARVVKMRDRRRYRNLIVVIDSSAPSFCHYETNNGAMSEKMDDETLKKVVYYALTENLSLTLLMGDEPLTEGQRKILRDVDYIQMRSIRALLKDVLASDAAPRLGVVDFESESELKIPDGLETVVLRIAPESFGKLTGWLEKNSSKLKRVSVALKGMERYRSEEIDLWTGALEELANFLPRRLEKGSFEISVLTDRLFETEPNHCEAGLKHFTIAPDGNFYLCPAFYYQEIPEPIESIDYVLKNHEIPVKNKRLLELKNAPICRECDAYHCKRCLWLNRQTTLEINTPSRQQCVVAHTERNESRKLIDVLGIGDQVELSELDYLDPYISVKKKRH